MAHRSTNGVGPLVRQAGVGLRMVAPLHLLILSSPVRRRAMAPPSAGHALPLGPQVHGAQPPRLLRAMQTSRTAGDVDGDPGPVARMRRRRRGRAPHHATHTGERVGCQQIVRASIECRRRPEAPRTTATQRRAFGRRRHLRRKRNTGPEHRERHGDHAPPEADHGVPNPFGVGGVMTVKSLLPLLVSCSTRRVPMTVATLRRADCDV